MHRLSYGLLVTMMRSYALVFAICAACLARTSTIQVRDAFQHAHLDNEIEEQKLELQQELLMLLGINEPPQLTHHHHNVVPAYMMNLYSRFSADVSDLDDEWPVLTADKTTLKATSIRGFLAQRGQHMMRSLLTQRFTFLSANINPSDVVLQAKLTMLWKPSEAANRNLGTEFVVSVYQYTRDDEKDAELTQRRTLSLQGRNRPQWLHFNVRRKGKNNMIVSRGGTVNFLVKVHAVGNDTNQLSPRDIGLSTYHVSQREQPLLVVYTHSKRRRFRRQTHERRERIADLVAQLSETRKRRASADDDFGSLNQTLFAGSALPSSSSSPESLMSKQQKRICHRREMNVTFREFGWNSWIIAPKTYQAYACRGECKFPFSHSGSVNKTNHAHVQALLHHMYPEDTPRVVCSPWSFNDLMILYYKETNEVVYQRYDDMIVTACGCR